MTLNSGDYIKEENELIVRGKSNKQRAVPVGNAAPALEDWLAVRLRTRKLTPVDVYGLTSGVKCWGDNSDGEFGDGGLFRTESVYALGLTSGACVVPENFCQLN